MKLLFLTHDTSRTGAPIVLLDFLKWIKDKQPDQEIHCIALEGGEMEEEFMKVSKCFNNLSTVKNIEETFVQKIQKKFLKKIRLYRPKPSLKEEFFNSIVEEHFDLIYANTVISIPLAIHFKHQSPVTKVIIHIHELSSIISLKLPNIERYFPFIDRIIVPSGLNKEHLIKNFSCPSAKIKKVNEFTTLEIRNQIKNRHEFIVGGAGTVHWRKGSDIFITIAKQLFKKHPQVEIKFEWIGSISKEERIIVLSDIEKAGLKNKVSFLGAKDNYRQYFENFNLLLLSSREDSFPLVAVEMGMLGKPIICFENATGIEEVVKKGAGFIVPYLDVEAMAEKIMVYYQNHQMLKSDGDIAKNLFSEFTPEKLCPKLYSIIKEEMDG